jgi:flagellar basal body-associated protein FliL
MSDVLIVIVFVLVGIILALNVGLFVFLSRKKEVKQNNADQDKNDYNEYV